MHSKAQPGKKDAGRLVFKPAGTIENRMAMMAEKTPLTLEAVVNMAEAGALSNIWTAACDSHLVPSYSDSAKQLNFAIKELSGLDIQSRYKELCNIMPRCISEAEKLIGIYEFAVSATTAAKNYLSFCHNRVSLLKMAAQAGALAAAALAKSNEACHFLAASFRNAYDRLYYSHSDAIAIAIYERPRDTMDSAAQVLAKMASAIPGCLAVVDKRTVAMAEVHLSKMPLAQACKRKVGELRIIYDGLYPKAVTVPDLDSFMKKSSLYTVLGGKTGLCLMLDKADYIEGLHEIKMMRSEAKRLYGSARQNMRHARKREREAPKYFVPTGAYLRNGARAEVKHGDRWLTPEDLGKILM